VNLGRFNLILCPGPDYPFFPDNGTLEERIFFISLPKEREKKSSEEGMMAICQAPPGEAKRWRDSLPRARSLDYLRFKEQITEEIGKHLEAKCPEFAGHVNYVGCSTPLTLRDQTNSPYGSLYGAKHRIEQYNPLPLTKLGNLFLAGQSIVAPGVLGAMISGFVACGSVVGHELLRKDLKQCL